MAGYDGWVVKNKWGSLLFWTFMSTRKEVITRKIGIDRWEKAWKPRGHKIVKIKFVEVNDGKI